MDDIAGKILGPGDLKALDDRARTGFVGQLRDTAKLLSYQKEGTAATMIAGLFLQAGVSNSVISTLDNATAIELIESVAAQMENTDCMRFIAASLFEEDGLVALVFDLNDGQTNFFNLNVDVPTDTVAGELFAGMFAKASLEKLASEQGAEVCWKLSEHFCNLSLR